MSHDILTRAAKTMSTLIPKNNNFPGNILSHMSIAKSLIINLSMIPEIQTYLILIKTIYNWPTLSNTVFNLIKIIC